MGRCFRNGNDHVEDGETKRESNIEIKTSKLGAMGKKEHRIVTFI